MFKKAMTALIGLFIFLQPSAWVGAEATQITLNAVEDKAPGGMVTISGSTTLEELTITVLRPNGTILHTDVLNGGGFSGRFKLPNDLAAGAYRVIAGNATTSATTSFNVAAARPGSGGGGGGSAQPPAAPKDARMVKISSPSFDAAKSNASADVPESDMVRALAGGAQGEEPVTAIIEFPKVEGAVSYTVGIPVPYLNTAVETHRIEIKTEWGRLLLPSHMLNSLRLQRAEIARLTIRSLDPSELNAKAQTVIGNRPAIGIELAVDNRKIAWHNPLAPVVVSIPYVLTDAERAATEHIVVLSIDESGRAVPVPTGRYDASAGTVSFKTTRFERYATAFVFRTFNDIDRYGWAKKAIEVLASKGVISGTSELAFDPGAPIRRADFVLLLVKALGLTATAGERFADVGELDYYADAVAIARELGIASGVGNNAFNPRASISRQEMMAMSHRALIVANKRLDAGAPEELSGFVDRDRIASYAADSVATFVRNGIVAGDGKRINPLGDATRAETAVLIYKIYNLQ
ncbi:hypothetical protein B1A99_25860 [Cohnella sp. CIP 111063]|uniref:S-layer homology domain-containing protein n=1 Tax=unclassified Cohnella TaxID=2636738 RepID=UPI000B8BE9D2|nr:MULTISPECIES: S-layer homology domain-containing protein [unclassified Cohnella]OXS54754.1 hypothetical protein B1A99_25860 [Cohnella sp. CIP 111063]PRX64591.1 S-layer family protein [Cohnella sp. SGD-V74]